MNTALTTITSGRPWALRVTVRLTLSYWTHSTLPHHVLRWRLRVSDARWHKNNKRHQSHTRKYPTNPCPICMKQHAVSIARTGYPINPFSISLGTLKMENHGSRWGSRASASGERKHQILVQARSTNRASLNFCRCPSRTLKRVTADAER